MTQIFNTPDALLDHLAAQQKDIQCRAQTAAEPVRLSQHLPHEALQMLKGLGRQRILQSLGAPQSGVPAIACGDKRPWCCRIRFLPFQSIGAAADCRWKSALTRRVRSRAQNGRVPNKPDRAQTLRTMQRRIAPCPTPAKPSAAF